MSSISFPHIGQPSEPGHDAPYYSPSFDTSSFQINPLSSHPPRTPRPSQHSSVSYTPSRVSTYGNNNNTLTFEEKDDGSQPSAETQHDEDGSALGESDQAKEVEKKILVNDVWRDMLVTSNGRDKAFVCCRYSAVTFYSLT